MSLLHGPLFGNALWILVALGWIALLLLGLETDKPLSGNLPGHGEPRAMRWDNDWDAIDELGETLGWALFGAVAVVLFFVLYWVLSAHGYGVHL